MYVIKNGILFHDGIARIALGQSYYPSYHPEKVPVPETGNREEEMVTDLREIREAGFNLCRMAALGDIQRNPDGTIGVQTPLADLFCEECERNDLAAMIRLQGYSVNLGNHENVTMLGADGEPMPFHWSWFVRTCLNHPGIIADNRDSTVESARHFGEFPNVVSFQIYNEPAYPSAGIYDYHPMTIEAYRGWLVTKGWETPETAATYIIPHDRPEAMTDPAPWIRWRLFQQERLAGFLGEMAEAAKQGYGPAETLTCNLGAPFKPGNAIRGVDYHTSAKTMDIVGITHYVPFRGPQFHAGCEILDGAESAAASEGKHAWIVEVNARTNIPPKEWERETYAILGRGYKGLLYYQWRADYPYPGSPEPEAFGMEYNDKRKTEAYPTALACNRLINTLSTYLASAEKLRSGLAILYSDHATAYFDAKDNRGCNGIQDAHDRYVVAMEHCYSLLNRQGVVCDFIRAEDLSTTRLTLDTLILPVREGLSSAETAAVKKFGGNLVVFDDQSSSFTHYQDPPVQRTHGIVYQDYGAEELITSLEVPIPVKVSGASALDARMLEGNGYALICLTNYDSLERPVRNASLAFTDTYNQATLHTAENPQGIESPVSRGIINLPQIITGGIILLRE